MAPEELLDRLITFAARVGKVVDALPETRLGQHVAGQMVRCGTSPAPNYSEACAAESTKDFIHKLSVALKELRETRTWLLLSVRAELLPGGKLSALIDKSIQLASIIGRSIATAKGRSIATAKEDKGPP
jgi:four helix bundle protein